MTHRKEVRRNPPSRAPRAQYMVLVRRFDPTGEELAPWKTLYRDDEGVTFFSPPKAKAAALAPPRDADLHVGDLLVTVPLEYASPLTIGEHATGLYVVTPKGVASVPKHPEFEERGGSWLSVWGQDAERMLSLAVNVDRRRLVMAACDCVETVLPIVAPGEERPRKAIETAVAWCRGAATLDQVGLATAGAATYAGQEAHAAQASSQAPRNWGRFYAARAASFAASIAFYHDARQSIVNVAFAVEHVFGTKAEVTYQRLAPIVERWVPLPVALLTWVRYPDAIPFDLSVVPTRTNPSHRTRRSLPRSHRR